MFDIGFLELLVCAILALLVLGPERLPKAARTAGLLLGKVRRSLNNMQDELERQVRTEELREKLKDPYATFIDTPAAPPAPTDAGAAEQNPALPETTDNHSGKPPL
ncbi:Sec-independent protein translocase protein TatB [Venatoribacter cucullus]|uniref:Sec-independent protein translocase protein TatB n=1 Tax=Venatoribacter cucullus TaxID=2661630 RepID=A0A9E8FIW4_9GAMM|nr:Sec-independent protein translocase protein TatB [Venatoribacter cucullus]QQD20391.1 twin-arginine translocase subunit TatB [Oceanospirillaceae bacterium ASx5O]QQD23096.1 twin-arginine translocase subunit TatB [Venatoribacter cucullus]UZK02529.1 twin-arginine translocase subunit TatB [Venatoribacter cucullus]